MWRLLAVCAGLFVTPASPPLATTELPYAEMKASGSVELIGEIEPGKPFEVVFTFTPLDTFVHTKRQLDRAYISGHDSSAHWISGDTLWEGFLETGKEYTLKARYVLGSSARTGFWGIVFAQQTLHKVSPPAFGPDKGIDYGFPSKAVFRSRVVDFVTDTNRIGEGRMNGRMRRTDSNGVTFEIIQGGLPQGLKRKPSIQFKPTEDGECLKCHAEIKVP